MGDYRKRTRDELSARGEQHKHRIHPPRPDRWKSTDSLANIAEVRKDKDTTNEYDTNVRKNNRPAHENRRKMIPPVTINNRQKRWEEVSPLEQAIQNQGGGVPTTLARTTTTETTRLYALQRPPPTRGSQHPPQRGQQHRTPENRSPPDIQEDNDAFPTVGSFKSKTETVTTTIDERISSQFNMKTPALKRKVKIKQESDDEGPMNIMSGCDTVVEDSPTDTPPQAKKVKHNDASFYDQMPSSKQGTLQVDDIGHNRKAKQRQTPKRTDSGASSSPSRNHRPNRDTISDSEQIQAMLDGILKESPFVQDTTEKSKTFALSNKAGLEGRGLVATPPIADGAGIGRRIAKPAIKIKPGSSLIEGAIKMVKSLLSTPTKRVQRHDQIQKSSRSFRHARKLHGDSDVEWRPQNRRITRSSRGKEVIELDCDSDEDSNQQTSSEPKVLSTHDVARIALGSRVFHEACTIRWLKNGCFRLCCKDAAKRHEHTIRFEEVIEVKYFAQADDPHSDIMVGERENITFLSMRALKTKGNGLDQVTNVYNPNDKKLERQFIVVEFRADNDLHDFLSLAPTTSSNPFIGNSNALTVSNTISEIERYCKALVSDSRAATRKRQEQSSARSRTGFLAGKDDDDILLAFPFPMIRSMFERSCQGLFDNGFQSDLHTDEVSEERGEVQNGFSSNVLEESSARAHHLEIRVRDYERLDDREFLNDTLIDFFMQCVTRMDKSNSIHAFSTHFYTTLKTEGVNWVSKWTMKKDVDIFSRRLIFIPINQKLHWSLCVVVNPGHILNSNKHDNKQIDFSAPGTCLLFFDSLRAHQKESVRKVVAKWLNNEWVRLQKSADDNPFSPDTFKVWAPKIPYQTNLWDCGVFVCKYALALYRLRSKIFSNDELSFIENTNMMNIISNGEEFKFSCSDITRMRDDMKILIERLSVPYCDYLSRQGPSAAQNPDRVVRHQTNDTSTCINETEDRNVPLLQRSGVLYGHCASHNTAKRDNDSNHVSGSGTVPAPSPSPSRN